MYSEIANILGWLGVICCTISYLTVSIGITLANDWKYQTLNAVGGTLLVVSALHSHDAPNTVVNALWAIIGFGNLLRILLVRVTRKAYH